MSAKKLFIAATLGMAGVGVMHLLVPNEARAQSNTSGAIQGTISDTKTEEKLAGVTVIATSPSLPQAQTAITDENGQYKISDLPPGEYLVTFYYANIVLERSGIAVGVNKVTPVFQKLDSSSPAAAGEKIVIEDTAPTIDPTSTTQGITIDKNYMKNVPVPGRTFEATLGAAAGSQGDLAGVSFSGSSSLENQYYVDGVNTTGLTYGTVGSPVINEFIEEIEVITGGYNAEYGRATGGVVNVVTKSGSNEFKGSVFGSLQPGAFTAAREVSARNAASIDTTANLAYDADFGFELGGPIIKDRLWFFVGFAPTFNKIDVTRTTKRQTDCRKLQDDGTLSECRPQLPSQGGFADTNPDVDPETGFFITDELDSEIRSQTLRAYNILGKVNFAATPENQGQLAVQALPATRQAPGIYGPPTSGFRYNYLTTDISGKWTSKFNDNKTEVELVAGWHRESVKSDAYDAMHANEPLQVLFDGSLGVIGPGFGAESPETNAGCIDTPPGGTDVYPYLGNNCPLGVTAPYLVGGPGSIVSDIQQRRAAKLSLTQRLKAAGSHEIKAGIDAEDNISDKSRVYSGGAFIRNQVGDNVEVYRWVQLLGQPGSLPVMNNTDMRFNNRCSTPNPIMGPGAAANIEYVCDYLEGELGAPGTSVNGNTLNWAAYIRDSWQIQPNLTLNVGLRYEEQRLRYVEFLRNKFDPLTMQQHGKNALIMDGMFAPRIGLLYDWTKEGRSKIYSHWGRFYESIPMDINDRSFGGEVQFKQDFAPSRCGMTDPAIGAPNGNGCVNPFDINGNSVVGDREELVGASGTLVAPGVKPQYMDEIIAGFEYEVIDDLKIGLSYQNRRYGRVIEDISTDGANTYVIANPGEWSSDEEAKFKALIDQTDDMERKALLQSQLNLFQGIRVFDKPRRDYNALQFTLTRRFSKKLYVQGSYTYSRNYGNYPGLISYDNGQVDPNISSQFDLIELLGNRVGPLPLDRPHYIKLDGYYTFDFKKMGDATVGIRLRALSGTPINALAGHYLYGSDEAFLLPRGQLGRTDFDHGLDVHLGYGKTLGKNMKIEAFVDIYNVYNRQGEAEVDTTYAPYYKLTAPNASSGSQQNANPVSGGTYEDLVWVKTIDTVGNETATPIGKNSNFRNTIVRYAPMNARIGMRLTF
ncbi:MAG: TonB-dependent receptor [Kofleriaceae bacterium]